ncbi:response regulator [Candidatus Chlorohelix sp.]|uniref:response regulator n=1 Tax=Candidatus Chlorohelix sp. TaxID=3139201 RepID=UPI00304151DF
MVVLVINETSALRKVVRLFFELHGYDAVEAANCSEGYARAAEYKPQIVLADNFIESMPYIYLCKNIQAIPGMETAEFVVFTEFEDELVNVSGINLKGIITKPNILPKLRNYFPPLK